MTQIATLPRPSLRSLPLLLALCAAALSAGLLLNALLAQVSGERGIAPVAASSDIEVSGIDVDVSSSTTREARETAWRQAQRSAWEQLNGPDLPDSRLDGLVSAIVIEKERVAPGRYIATLGVIFDRTRAAGLLGGDGEALARASAPMLVVPVTYSAGSATVFEMRNPWQRAWAEFQPGRSPVNYVRPTGSGGDSLLLTSGQVQRRSRTWWRNILDQFGAADVIVPIARLDYRWPGGPIDGTFTARYGPDNRFLEKFEMSANTPAELPNMLGKAVTRFDTIFRKALAKGKLRPDPTLNLGSGESDPAIARLIQIGSAIRDRELAVLEGASEVPVVTATEAPTVLRQHSVQFATPDAQAFDATLGQVRGTPGVRGAAISSTAIGGTSVMQVTYAGSLDQLAAALRGRGFTVVQGSSALAISR
ncbi:heavy-metal-associated domain-containing protein [Altererythrobacter sp. MF3-039]|uniref:heavy-metal-associated domain-containing protein n=1 Tax=Altererythrobacter sp. MF3-039 TaxID=3252901 RepID=UPI00390C98E9